MTDKTKKALKITSAVAIAIGAVGYVLTGGTEAGAMNIVSVSLLAVVAITAVIAALKE